MRSIRHEPESRSGSTGLMAGARVLPRPMAIRPRSMVLTDGAQAAPRPAATRQPSTVLLAGGLAPQPSLASAKAKTVHIADHDDRRAMKATTKIRFTAPQIALVMRAHPDCNLVHLSEISFEFDRTGKIVDCIGAIKDGGNIEHDYA